MSEIDPQNPLKYSSDSLAFTNLIEQFEETKQLLVKWVDKMDKIIEGSKTSIDEFKEALDTFARRIGEWRSILEEATEGSKKEEELLTPIRTSTKGNIEEEEVKEEISTALTGDMTYEEKKEIKSYARALKQGGWDKSKIVETLSEREFNGRRFDRDVLSEITEEMFD